MVRGRPPPDEPHGARLVHVAHRVEVVAPFERPERRADPRLRQLPGHRLRDLLVAHVASLRAVEDDVHAVGKTGLGQELLRAGEVLLDRLQRGVVAEVHAGQHRGHPDRLAVHHTLDDLIRVDGVGDGLADALVGGGSVVGPGRLVVLVHLVRVDHELDGADRRRRAQEDLRVLLDDGGEVRRDVDGDVDLAVLERSHADGVVGDGLEHDGLDVGRAPPVAGEGLHHDLLVLRPAHELVRSGSDRVLGDGRGVLPRVLLGGIHRRLPQGHVAHEHRPRLLGVDPDRVGVHDLHVVDGSEGRGAAELVGRIGEPLEADLHRVCVEVLPVVELGALAQLDLPGGRSHQLRQLGGQPGDQLQALVALDEHVEHLGPDVRRRLLLLVHHVERRRIHALSDHHLARGSGHGRPGKQQSGEDDESDAPMPHVEPPRPRESYLALTDATLGGLPGRVKKFACC